MIRILLVFWLILYSLRYRTRPWNFFQLNRKYFNLKKNIFSKLEQDEHIPSKWRLLQNIDDGRIIPKFPVVIKPEWGQNSNGVVIARNLEELEQNRQERPSGGVNYLLQQIAPEKREFEFFYIRSVQNIDRYAVASLTETVNFSGEELVVNGVHNGNSAYKDLRLRLSEKELCHFWEMVKSIGCFKIARIGMRADSLEKLLQGEFHIMEINIFLPMPLMLLDRGKKFSEKYAFIKESMKAAALLGANEKVTPKSRQPIFFRNLIAHYRVKQ